MARSGCCCAFPYVAIIAAIVAAAGVGLWWVEVGAAYSSTLKALDTLGVVYQPIRQFKASQIGYLIVFCVDVLVLVLLAIWRSASLCKRNAHASSASRHTFFSWIASIFAFLHFLVVVWLVVNMVAVSAASTTLGLAHFATGAAATEMAKLGANSDILNSVRGVVTSYDDATKASPELKTLLQGMGPAINTIRPWVNANGSTNSTENGCPPFCLDLGMFKFVRVRQRCICDPQVLNATSEQTRVAAVQGATGLIGGLILLVGLLWLLMNICGQIGGSCTDSWHINAKREDPEYQKAQQFHTA